MACRVLLLWNHLRYVDESARPNSQKNRRSGARSSGYATHNGKTWCEYI